MVQSNKPWWRLLSRIQACMCFPKEANSLPFPSLGAQAVYQLKLRSHEQILWLPRALDKGPNTGIFRVLSMRGVPSAADAGSRSSSDLLSPVIRKEEHYDKCVYTLCYMSTVQCKLAFLISLNKSEVSHTWYWTKSSPIPRMHVFWPMKRQKKIIYFYNEGIAFGERTAGILIGREKKKFSFLSEHLKSWSKASK